MRIFLFIIILLFCTNVHALTQCIKLAASTVCATSDDCYSTSDCTVDCDGTTVNIVGRCASTSGTADTDSATNISTSGTTSENLYCWCKMTAPAISKWIARYTYTSANMCAKNCARGCRNGMIFDNDMDQSFRKTMLNNLLE